MLSRYYIQHCCFRGDRGLVVVVVVVLEETLFCSQYMYHLQCTACTAGTCTAYMYQVYLGSILVSVCTYWCQWTYRQTQ